MARTDLVDRAGSVYLRRARSTAEERGEHGTVARYGCGCRCTPCRRARRQYDRLWWATRQVERSGELRVKVPTARAADAVRQLQSSGMTLRQVAKAAGCSRPTICRIVSPVAGRRTWSTIETALLELADRVAP